MLNQRRPCCAAFFASALPVFSLGGAVLFGLAWLIPNRSPPWVSFYNDAAAALALACLALGSARTLVTLPAPKVAWAVVALAAVPPFQFAVGQLVFGGDAIISALYILGFASAIIVGYAVETRHVPSLAVLMNSAVVMAGVLSSCIALNQVFEVGGLGIWAQDLPPGGRAFGNLGQPNNFATLTALSAIGILGLKESGRLTGLSALALLIPVILGACVSQSRTALVFGPVIAIGVWAAAKRGCRFQTRLSTIWIGAACHIGMTMIWPRLQSTLLLLSFEQTVAQKGLESLRYRMWAMLGEGLLLKPWQGYGWLQVGEAELAVAKDHPPIEEYWSQAHNLILDVLLWCGIPLGSLFALALVYWIVSRGRRIDTRDAVLSYLSVMIVLLHSLLEFPYQYAYFLIPVGLWVGMVERGKADRPPISGLWNLGPLAAAGVLFVGVCRDYPAIEEDFRLVRFERLRIGLLHSAVAAPDAPMLSSLTAFLAFQRIKVRPGMTPEELARAEAVVKRYPYALTLARYGQMMALNDRMPQALRAYEAIRRMYPVPIYVRLRNELEGLVSDGRSDLKPLLDSLPSPSRTDSG